MSELPTKTINDPNKDLIMQNASETIGSTQEAADFSQWEKEFLPQAQRSPAVIGSVLDHQNHHELYKNFTRWETGVGEFTPSDSEILDLNAEELPNSGFWNQEELDAPVQAIERIEEAKSELTRADLLTMSVNYLTNPQCVADIRNTTHTLISVRQFTRG